MSFKAKSESPSSPRPGMKSFLYCLLVLAMSLGINVILAWRIENFGRRPSASNPGFPIGLAMPSLPVRAIDGEPHALTFEGAPTVLYVMTPGCKWCEQNADIVNRLALATGGRVRFLGLSLSGANLKTYLRAHPPAFPFFQTADPQFNLRTRLPRDAANDPNRRERCSRGSMARKTGPIPLPLYAHPASLK